MLIWSHHVTLMLQSHELTFHCFPSEVDSLLESEAVQLLQGREVDLSRHSLALEDLLRHTSCICGQAVGQVRVY